MEFFTKETKIEFVELMKKDDLICHEQIAVDKAQIPKYAKPTNPSVVQ